MLCQAKECPHREDCPSGAGDIWTWVGIDADSKLAVSWHVGGRDSDEAIIFIDDLAKCLAHRIQLTSDGHKTYFDAVEGAFGADIDYAMMVKIYGQSHEGTHRDSPAECTGAIKRRIEGKPGPKHVGGAMFSRFWDVYRDIRSVIQKPDDALYILHTLIRIQLSSIRLAPDFRRKLLHSWSGCGPGKTWS